MNNVSNQSSSVGQNSLTAQQLSQSQPVVDAEVVKKVATVEIKPSNVQKESVMSQEAVAKAAAQIQKFVQEMGRNLSFTIDETTGYNVVRVMNPETNEVIRQLPSEELLKIARSMEQLNSVLVNQKA
jgi:flagellar protein FlaG